MSARVGAILVLAMAACSTTEPTVPTEPVTLLVTNNSCAAGRCMTLELRAVVGAFAVPQGPYGGRVMGYAPPGTRCITLPDTMSLRISGPNASGVEQTTVLTWNRSHPAGIALVGVDSFYLHGQRTQGQLDSVSAGLPPYHGDGASVGRTVMFVPGDEAGWRISFPVTGATNAQIVAAPSCQTSPHP